MSTKLNLEMACTQAMIVLALKLRPQAVVRRPREQDGGHDGGGLDVAGGCLCRN